jgi:hypothetical protein
MVDLAQGTADDEAPTGEDQQALAEVRAWLERHPGYGKAPVRRFEKWAQEVARFSFSPPVTNGTLARSGR